MNHISPGALALDIFIGVACVLLCVGGVMALAGKGRWGKPPPIPPKFRRLEGALYFLSALLGAGFIFWRPLGGLLVLEGIFFGSRPAPGTATAAELSSNADAFSHREMT
jgi:hypothetical protein